MSMNLSVAGARVAALLIAALMIGCGNSERNSTGAPGEAGQVGVTAEGSSSSTPGAVQAGAEGGGPLRVGAAGSGAALGASAEDEAATAPRNVLFVGTSLTAGQGLPEEQSFPRLIQSRIDEAGLPYRVVNAGVSGETSAGALARIDWLLRQPFDVVVIETGANDMLRGIDPGATERNIQTIIDRIRSSRPDASIVLAGMLALPNLGAEYAREFEAMYPRLAERNEIPLIPFLLQNVAGEEALNQNDGVHPTAEGQRIVAGTVWETLGSVLRQLQAETG